MRYETLLFTRNQQQDYSALVRPEAMSERDITTLRDIVHSVSDTGRLREDVPCLYYFPLGEYALLVRHYDSGRRYEGQAIAVLEGVAVKLGDGDIDRSTAAKLVAEQADLLNVSAAISDIELHTMHISDAREFDGSFESETPASFVSEFVERREREYLFLPFTPDGRAMLVAVLADSRFDTPPYFAFGTNSEVLARLERLAPIDLVSFFKTDRVSFRDRKTHQVTRYLDEDDDELDYEASRTQRLSQYVKPRSNSGDDDTGAYEDTRVGSQAMPIQSVKRSGQNYQPNEDDEYDPDDTVLTMQQIPAGATVEEAQESNPLRRMTRKLSSLLVPRKTE